jgi:hypothetical protein
MIEIKCMKWCNEQYIRSSNSLEFDFSDGFRGGGIIGIKNSDTIAAFTWSAAKRFESNASLSSLSLSLSLPLAVERMKSATPKLLLFYFSQSNTR